ncbi:MAG: hypothetical protein ACKOD5_03190, partial [Chthoniobacterales bacterium]
MSAAAARIATGSASPSEPSGKWRCRATRSAPAGSSDLGASGAGLLLRRTGKEGNEKTQTLIIST